MKTFTAAKSEIVERMRKLSPDAKAQWGRMSAHQMVCHLADSYRLAMGECHGSDKSNFFTKTVMKFGALRIPLQWPQGVPTVPELDQVAGAGTQPAIFEADHARLLQLFERFAATPRDFTFGRHPMFVEMSEWEWMRWAYLHADHHLRQFGV